MSNVSLIDGHIDYDEMTPQKALAMLNDVEFSEKYQGNHEHTDMLLFCKEALEKQIPKKVIIQGLNPSKEISSISFVCPSCKQHISRQRYCPNCGQALDRSDAE